ncbi:MAG: flavin reductase family protein [Selenomonadaceae bacterium]|nr:flavin reductase family protein [Selenomonadaceae bacterium]
MKEIDFTKAMNLTSPQPLMAVCTRKADGTTNIAPVSFLAYVSFQPPMIAFAMMKPSLSGERFRETKEAILAVPSGKIGNALLYCGKVSGRTVDKAAKCKLELVEVAGSEIKIPAETEVAFVVSLNQVVETGDHFLHICDIKKILADESKNDMLFAWNGYSKIAAAVMK